MSEFSKMAEHYTDLSYIINGEAGVGKTTLAYEMGYAYDNNPKGTYIITVGREPLPPAEGYYNVHCNTFLGIVKAIKEFASKPHDDTKFIAIDSMDELARLGEEYAIDKSNEEAVNNADDRHPAKVSKSINTAFGGYGGGRDFTRDSAIIKIEEMIHKAGCKPIWIGHVKVKSNTDIFTGVTVDRITCSISDKYYSAIKDKVNIACCLYKEKTFNDVKEVEKKFNKKEKQKKGTLIGEKRVCVFKDDGYAIDLKTHYPDIPARVDLDRYAQNFIMAVEEAIEAKRTEEERNPRPMSFKERLKANKKLESVAVDEDIHEASVNLSESVEESDELDNEAFEEMVSESVEEKSEPAETKTPTVPDEEDDDFSEYEESEDDEAPFDDDEDEDEKSVEEMNSAVVAEWKSNEDYKKKGMAYLKSKGIKSIKNLADDVVKELYKMI